MKKIFSALSLIVILNLTGSHGFTSGGGGWIGSGGEIFNYSKNPWFLRNTLEVKYCIAHDTSSTSASTEDLRRSIQFAIEYWKKELFQKSQTGGVSGELLLATQKFTEISCADSKSVDIDLKIKFGYNSLSDEEIIWLKNPQRYVGISVRQSYDLENLKAKGFIFIASDKGEKSYSNPNGKLISNAWENKQLLNYVLVHEFGHVFGVPHSGTGLMSETFFDELLSKRMAPFYAKQPVMRFLTSPQSSEVCKSSQSNGEFNSSYFKADPNTSCIKLLETKPLSEFQVLGRLKNSDTFTELGKILLTSSSARKFGTRPAVILQLPPEQKVFNSLEIPFGSFLVGPVFVDVDFRGVFKFPGSESSNSVYVDLRPDSVSVRAIVSQKIEPVFTYVQPSLLQMMTPIEEQ